MLTFAKLVSGEIIIGDLIGKELRHTVGISVSSNNNIHITPVIPFDLLAMPTIKSSKTICMVPVHEEQHVNLISTYKTIKEQTLLERNKRLH